MHVATQEACNSSTKLIKDIKLNRSNNKKNYHNSQIKDHQGHA